MVVISSIRSYSYISSIRWFTRSNSMIVGYHTIVDLGLDIVGAALVGYYTFIVG